jgi:carboxymethylenebutenolidase
VKPQAAKADFRQSFLTQEDLKDVQVPVYVGLAGEDEMVPASLPDDLKSWTQQERVQATFEIYPGMSHGFAARPDTEDPAVRTQYERALKAAVSFLGRSILTQTTAAS